MGACDGCLHETGDKKMIRMTAIVFVLLGFLMMPVGESYAGQSKSAQTFCKIRPYAAGNEILTGVTATGLSLKLASSAVSLKTYWEYHRSYQSYVRNTAIDNKALIRILGMWKPLRFFTKSLIPFMAKHRKLVKLIKHNSKSKTQLGDIMTASKAHDWNALYQRLKKIRLVWLGAVSVPSAALFASTLAVCKEAEVFSQNICVKKKKNCSVEEDDEVGDVEDNPNGEYDEVQMYQSGSMCAMSDDQKAKQFVSYANRQRSTINKAYDDVGKLKKFVGVYGARIKAFNATMNPVINPLKAAINKLKVADKVLDPAYKVLGLLQKVMKKRICITYKVPGTKKVCTKKKIFGKKTKICARKPTFTKKKKCTRVETALNDVSKAAKIIQKPLEALLKKTLDPIVKKLVKKIPGIPSVTPFKRFQKAMNKLNTLGAVIRQVESLSKLPFTSHKNAFLRMKTKLRSLQ